MAGINKNKLFNVVHSTAEDRYLYFIRKVSDFEQVWGLYDEGWAQLKNEDNQIVLPFWPEEQFAKICAQGVWNDFKPKSISLNDFINKWLPGMQKDNTLTGVFLTPEEKGVVVESKKLLDDISQELEQYQ